MAYVYRHIRLDKNEPFYIGIGKSNGYYSRANTKYSRNAHWKNIVAKTDFEVDILIDDVSDEYAREKEKEFIKLYGRKDKNEGTLVNMTDGGDGALNKIISKEVAEKISKSNLGKTHTKEVRERLSKSHKERYKNNPELARLHSLALKGKKRPPRTAEHSRKLAESQKNRTYSDETKKRMSDASARRKQILQYDLNGNFVKEWNAIKDAAKFYGLNSSVISKCCIKHKGVAKGYTWEYKEHKLKNI